VRALVSAVCVLPSEHVSAGNLSWVSLFDVTAVTPPGPCSRCGSLVAPSSLFCPDCGQSMIRPRETPEVVIEEPASAPDDPSEKEEPREPDTLQRATGWIRRSLNLGKKPLFPDTTEEPSPEGDAGTGGASMGAPLGAEQTQEMSLFDIHQAEEVPADKPRRLEAPLRFILKFDTGLSVTVGAKPGVIGVQENTDDLELHRIYVKDPTHSIAMEHIEFGVTDGVFWVKDLNTASGTIVEEPGSQALQCIPYDTYSLVRGSIVTLGAVSFTLH